MNVTKHFVKVAEYHTAASAAAMNVLLCRLDEVMFEPKNSLECVNKTYSKSLLLILPICH